MKKWLYRVLMVLFAGYVVASSSWLQAATYKLVSDTCDMRLAEEARDRVLGLYGQLESDPVIVCTSNQDNWLGVLYGETRFAVGLPALIVIGPKGTNTDVMAHELAHAELFSRIGLIKRELLVPTWFDEGLAMQVDHREPYNLEALSNYNRNKEIVPVTVEQIEGTQFFAAPPQGRYHYALSRCLMSVWIESNSDYLQKIENWSAEHSDAAYENGIDHCGSI